MNAAESRSQREKQLPDLDALDVQSLKALVLAKQAELDSRTTEVENLKLLILKLKRMHLARVRKSATTTSNSSNCGWKTWKPTGAAAEPPPIVPATVALNQKASLKPARRPLPAALPRERRRSSRSRKRAPIAAAHCGGWARTYRRHWNMFRRGSK